MILKQIIQNPKNWLILHSHDSVLKVKVQKYFTKKLVDIGCGVKPYQTLVAPYITEHIGVDHLESIHNRDNVDRDGTAYQIPANDEEFDSAICTYVLEHLEEPAKAIQECNRVLKKGGYAIYSVPLFWHLHEEPRDFYRYTKHGLRYLFETNGFKIIEIIPLTGFWTTFLQEFVYYFWRFGKGPLKIIVIPISILVQMIAWLLDWLDRVEVFTCDYILVAQKS